MPSFIEDELNREGYMHVDGYNAYESTQAILVACLAHIRREFIDVKKLQGKKKIGKVAVVLNLIGKLYEIEKRIKGKSVEEKLAIRQSQAKPIGQIGVAVLTLTYNLAVPI